MGTKYRTVTLDDFKIKGKGYKRWKFRRKLKRSSLSTQEASVLLKLLN